LLTIHFVRRVEIRAIRFYVDYNQDESYTPTNIVFCAGSGHHDLIQFAEVPMTNPVGWQDVPVADAGGGADGRSLCCHLVQMHIKENHQNGKDTHIRGIKIYARDEHTANGRSAGGTNGIMHGMETNIERTPGRAPVRIRVLGDNEGELGGSLDSLDGIISRLDDDILGDSSLAGFSGAPDWMREPEIR
jgi:anaphase-promoting complex subunit 10